MSAPRRTACVRRASLVLLVLTGACKAHHAGDEECNSNRCIELEDDDGKSALGVRDVGHPTPNGYASLCQLVVRRAGSPSAVGFRATTVAPVDDVAILDGALGQVHRCSGDPEHPHAVVLLNPPAYAWAIPHEGDVFVPFDEYDPARLDDGAHARALVERDSGGLRQDGHYCVVAGPRGDNGDVQCDLHIGSTFAWGSHPAEIVRIVPPIHPFTGWIEVALR